MMDFLDLSKLSPGMRLKPIDLEAVLRRPRRNAPYFPHLQLLRELKARALPGDVFYYYCSERAQWEALMGSDGYIAVRDGVVVDSLVLRMN